MKKIFVLVLVLFILPHGTVSIPENKLVINRYDAQSANWITVTLNDMNYVVNTSTGNKYVGKLVNDIWGAITQLTEAISFYSLSNTAIKNYTLSIALQTDKGSNIIYLTPELEDYSPNFEKFVGCILNLGNRITGMNFQQNAWPVDISILQTRTIPSTYYVTSVLQRGPDMLAYVLDVNVTLIIGESVSDIYNITWMQSALYVQKKLVSFTTGGNSVQLTFDPFGLTNAEDSSNLTFAIILNIPLLYNANQLQPILLNENVSVTQILVNTPIAENVSISSTYVITILMLLFVSKIKKKYSVNNFKLK